MRIFVKHLLWIFNELLRAQTSKVSKLSRFIEYEANLRPKKRSILAFAIIVRVLWCRKRQIIALSVPFIVNDHKRLMNQNDQIDYFRKGGWNRFKPVLVLSHIFFRSSQRMIGDVIVHSWQRGHFRCQTACVRIQKSATCIEPLFIVNSSYKRRKIRERCREVAHL